jgi:hypothetical protein
VILPLYKNKGDVNDPDDLKVNSAKTNVVIFSLDRNRMADVPQFSFDHKNLELVHDFSYVGIKCMENGKFVKTRKRLIDQAKKAMFSLIKKLENCYYQ